MLLDVGLAVSVGQEWNAGEVISRKTYIYIYMGFPHEVLSLARVPVLSDRRLLAQDGHELGRRNESACAASRLVEPSQER
jgi:hypothetical protein